MKPGYEPATLEAQLGHLVEECAEVQLECAKVQQAAGKILRFGLENANPDELNAPTNRIKLLAEMLDLERALARLRTTLVKRQSSIPPSETTTALPIPEAK